MVRYDFANAQRTATACRITVVNQRDAKRASQRTCLLWK